MKSIVSKSIICVLFTALSLTAFASEQNSGVNAGKAQAAVQAAAHRFIARNAPDFGGFVKSPCSVNLISDQYTVTCKGTAEETIGGGGSVPVAFQCIGVFNQGQGGLFFQNGALRCKSI